MDELNQKLTLYVVLLALCIVFVFLTAWAQKGKVYSAIAGIVVVAVYFYCYAKGWC